MCHRWHKLLLEASMWPVVDLAPRHFWRVGTPLHASVINWLHQRGPGMRQLTLRVSACFARWLPLLSPGCVEPRL